MTSREVKSLYRSPVRMPNGLQWYGGELYVMDQLTDDVFVLDEKGSVKRVIWTETVNGSGITVSDGYIWTACNSKSGATARPKRPYDDHVANVRKVDIATGETVDFSPHPTAAVFTGLNGMMATYG